MTRTSLTIIDTKNIRGVVAPAKIISKEILENIIDFIEWSDFDSIREAENRAKEASRSRSWISGKEVERRLKRRTGLER